MTTSNILLTFTSPQFFWFTISLLFTKFVSFLYANVEISVAPPTRSMDPIGFHNWTALSHLLQIFSNCSTILEVRNGTHIFVSSTPIILVDGALSETDYGMTDTLRIYITRRRNILGHCWAYIILLPENDPYLDEAVHYWRSNQYKHDLVTYFTEKQYYVGKVYIPQYMVLVTKFKSEYQKVVQSLGLRIVTSYKSLNLVLVPADQLLCNQMETSADKPLSNQPQDQLSSNQSTNRLSPKQQERSADKHQISLHCYNRYYSKFSVKISPPWTTINCKTSRSTHCFDLLTIFTDDISHLNKYFWEFDDWLNLTSSTSDSHSSAVGFVENKYFTQPLDTNFDSRELARDTTFGEFIGFWLFADILPHLLNRNLDKIHFLKSKSEFRYIPGSYHSLLPIKSKSWNVISCYRVGSHTSTLSQLFTPFEKPVWTLILPTVVITFILLTVPRTNFSAAFLFVVGILLENSVVSWKTNFRTLTGFYIFLFGTILTNFYKTSFTKEMILPVEQTAPWKTILDTINFTFYVPYETIIPERDINAMETFGLLDYLFYSEISIKLASCATYLAEGRLTTLQTRYSDFFRQLLETIKVQIIKDVRTLISPNLKPLSHQDAASFVEILSSCNKTGYLDTAENVIKLQEFLNDALAHKIYKKGEDGFMQSTYGWENVPVQNSYVWKRLKAMISSGIYNYWDNYFKRLKPEKSFQHYANLTNLKDDQNTGMQSKSKILTGFSMYGVCVAIVGICLPLK
ncbi:hypothetical protein Fcan01_11791 [Folsomia candida]|uniref:Uncharacterized protein n=1 Tax=Folsomia candida TaxID=158441 RepID=A0A226E716_FOLCA|nr:hypothetical protein Fcan01_11791 [Folsomia candida]